MRWKMGVALLLGTAVVAVGCSGEVSFQVGGKDPKDAAEDRIEEADFVEQIGLGQLTAECNDPGEVEEGDVFLCTADTESGDTIDITATIVDGDTLNVRSTNLMLASDVQRASSAAVELLNEQNDLSFPPGVIDCGTDAIVLPEDKTFPCVLKNPGDGKQYDTTITVTDLAAGTFKVNVSGEPRS